SLGDMLRSLLAFLFLVVTVGVAEAAPPEVRPITIDWTLRVIDSNKEKHEYVFSRSGGQVRVDADDWTCVYDAIKPDAFSGVYSESTWLHCIAGTHYTAIPVMCVSKAIGGRRQASLVIGNAKKTNTIYIGCDPQ